jgi:integrase
MRIFLRDCQEWQWIAVRLNPDRALRTPHSITKLTGPSPRTVDKQAWAKVLWAAMNLEAEDIPQTRGRSIYPIEMVRAVAVVWCFAALRSDEIVRLRVGCVRWQYEDVMIPETGEILPKDATCFLDIPVNKTETAYTKPVHPLVGKRINEWEQMRPKEQPKALDRKTSEPVQYLFSYRGKRLSKNYINLSLISSLCQKAGIPDEDSRGASRAIVHGRLLRQCSTMPKTRWISSSFKSIWVTSGSLQRKVMSLLIRPGLLIRWQKQAIWSRTWRPLKCS